MLRWYVDLMPVANFNGPFFEENPFQEEQYFRKEIQELWGRDRYMVQITVSCFRMPGNHQVFVLQFTLSLFGYYCLIIMKIHEKHIVESDIS